MSATFVIPGRLFTTNSERRMHHYDRARRVAEWRQAAWGVAHSDRNRPRHLTDVTVEATPIVKDRRSQDVGGCLPCVKAAIDGLVDAHVMDDDDPTVLRRLTFCAPELSPSKTESLRLVVCGEAA